MAYSVVAPVFTWDGLYVGATGGYGFSGQNHNTHDNDNFFGSKGGTFNSDDVKGAVYGGHLGYNVQSGMFVLGAELGLNKSNLGGSVEFPQYTNYTYTNVDWYGTAKLRAGVVIDNALIYVNGGYLGGNVGISNVYTPAAPLAGRSFGSEGYRSGYTLGAGVEYAFANHWIARVEYERLQFGGKTYSGVDNNGQPGQSVVINNSLNANVVKAGLSYKF